jgi:4-diphosphocytidyl-2-C-methyl-D-erythritol kinase
MQYFPAPAKLNLFLHVVGRRADGYHLLQSVFRLIDAADEVGIVVRDDGVIRRVKPVAGVTEEADLCLRAARLLQARTHSTLGADIDLVKHLPIGGGLGGGSSDAATVLWVLNALWKTGLAQAELQKLGAELGADVPFFLFGEPAFVEGTGERMTPVTIAPAWYLVLVPPVQVATAGIFGAAELKRDTAAIAVSEYREGFGGNDLQPVSCARYSEVARHLAWLSQRAKALMTGSGACVFAPFASSSEASAVLSSLPAGMQGFVARGLDSHPLWQLAPLAAK